jgi:hypothetical protein
VVFRAAGIASACSLVAAPALTLTGEALFGDGVHAPEVFAGALLGTMFFAVTAVAAGIFQNGPALRTAVMWSYAAKTVLVFAMFLTVDLDRIDRDAFGFSTMISAFTYLSLQTVLIAQRKRFFRP